ncbi:MAG: beta-N-acetylhexosaminidase, partial [Gemmatimonadota bacterium]|nr:beta-N-acetylhexosaminidase [Gemmatimonadota bacterium]
IVIRRDTSLSRLGREGYRLEARPGRITVRAPTATGAFYAVQTIRQLLPPEIFREAPVNLSSTDSQSTVRIPQSSQSAIRNPQSSVRNRSWSIPAVTIEDEPRFTWRGGHLDVSRHFMPKEFVKKYIDLLALHKMNTFHWHLTDDQGWRLEIKKYPRLTEVGAWRKETLVGRHEKDPAKRVFDGERHGGFYTQDDVREIVAYAKARHITVVPEIEMPGHARAAIAAYPHLGVVDDTLEVLTVWADNQSILNAEMRTVEFMQDVLTETLQLFPSKFIHVGGDEAVKTLWKSSPRVQARMRELGIDDEDELQSWFIRQMSVFLTKRGRRLVGWDEILEGGLPPSTTVMSWRGTRGGIAAARQGHDVIMAPSSHLYFDHYQSRDREGEPLAIGGFTPIDSVYAFEPVPRDLESRFAHHILGAQGQIWTEYIKGPKQVEYMAYPRMTALAEVLWTPKSRKDFAGFMQRMGTHAKRLEILDVGFRAVER